MGLRLEFKPANLWIGAFWKTDCAGRRHLWICLLPMLPIHLELPPRIPCSVPCGDVWCPGCDGRA